MKQRYEVQAIAPIAGEAIANYRVTDTKTDSRVATCYTPEFADLVALALNVLELSNPAPGESNAGFPFWLVACTETNMGMRSHVEMLASPPRFCHDSEKDAEGEARRLACAHHHHEFAVMKSVAVVKWNSEENRLKWDEATE